MDTGMWKSGNRPTPTQLGTTSVNSVHYCMCSSDLLATSVATRILTCPDLNLASEANLWPCSCKTDTNTHGASFTTITMLFTCDMSEWRATQGKSSCLNSRPYTWQLLERSRVIGALFIASFPDWRDPGNEATSSPYMNVLPWQQHNILREWLSQLHSKLIQLCVHSKSSRGYLPACVCEEDHCLVLCVMKLVQEVNQVAVLDLGLEPVQSSNFICNQGRERETCPSLCTLQ